MAAGIVAAEVVAALVVAIGGVVPAIVEDVAAEVTAVVVVVVGWDVVVVGDDSGVDVVVALDSVTAEVVVGAASVDGSADGADSGGEPGGGPGSTIGVQADTTRAAPSTRVVAGSARWRRMLDGRTLPRTRVEKPTAELGLDVITANTRPAA